MDKFNPAAARARCEAIVGARRARSQLMTDDPKLTFEYLALTDLPAALEIVEAAQKVWDTVPGEFEGPEMEAHSEALVALGRILKGE